MTRHLLRNSVMTDLMPHRRLSARSASSYAVIFSGTRVPRQLLSASWVLCFFLSSRRRHGLWMEGACCVGCVHENHQDFTRWRHIHRGRNITFQIGAQKPQKKKCCFFSGLVDQRQGDEAGRKEKKFIHSAQCGEKKNNKSVWWDAGPAFAVQRRRNNLLYKADSVNRNRSSCFFSAARPSISDTLSSWAESKRGAIGLLRF